MERIKHCTQDCSGNYSKNLELLDRYRDSACFHAEKKDVPTELISEKLIDGFFHALNPLRGKLLSKGRDLDIIKRTAISILELTEEQVLTEQEANALIELLAAKFVQHRFDRIFSNIFDLDISRKYSFHMLTGKVK
jgi:hypothetical protein